jgi:hypothetical protein
MDGRLKRIPSVLLMSFNYVSLAMSFEVPHRAYLGLENLIDYSFMSVIFFVSIDSEIRSGEHRVFTKNHFRNPLVEF